MKIAVTGCNGSVGSRVVRLALSRGHTVVGVDTAPIPSSDNIESLDTTSPDQYTFQEVNLTDYDTALHVLRGCDAVVQLAGIRHPLDYAVKAHNTNVVITWNILRAAAELGITRVAQASSVNVVAARFSVKPDFQYFPIDETHPCRPDEPYGLSKVICESQADTIVRRYPNLRVASIRLHYSLPQPRHADYFNEDTAKDLWGWVQEDAGADAFLRCVEITDTTWIGHEAFLITAPTIDVAPDAPVDSAVLKDKFWPHVPVREGFAIEGRKGFYDCTKAERLLGWKHP